MSANALYGTDPCAPAAAVVASATSAGAATAAIAGNTMAVYMDVNAPFQVLPSLAGIWACKTIRRYTHPNNKNMWICEWCSKGLNNSKPFTGWNATNILWHVWKISGNGILPCSGVLLPEYARQYKDYYKRRMLDYYERRMLHSQAREN